MTTTEDTAAWNEWFDKQYDLTEQIDRAIAGLSKGKTDQFRAALWAGVLEHGGEAIRGFIPLTASDDTVKAHSLTNCWCGVAHRGDEFL